MTDNSDIQERDAHEAQKAAFLKARKQRNLWIGLGLFGFVFLVGLLTALRVAENGLGPGQEVYYHYDGDGQ